MYSFVDQRNAVSVQCLSMKGVHISETVVFSEAGGVRRAAGQGQMGGGHAGEGGVARLTTGGVVCDILSYR